MGVNAFRQFKAYRVVVYWHIDWKRNSAEIGYELLPEYQGKGIMSEALEKVIGFGFANLGFETITAAPKK
jgi:[ribosomal protein S5]-alanine N-acetyltransferase